MGKRTLVSSWKQYQKLSQSYINKPDQKDEIITKLDNLTEKINGDNIGNALFTLFVKPFVGKCKLVDFSNEHSDRIPNWQTKYDEDAFKISIHPLSIFNFIETVKHIEVPDKSVNFIGCRNSSLLVEISKLPSTYILFLMVLQRVAFLLQIAHLEKRGGIIEVAEDESYHTMLWAFKELEAFAKKTYGINIRVHYGISWYEAEWITGK